MAAIKNAGLAERGELDGRERRSRNVGPKEIRRKWTRFRYFGVRIAHRWSRASDLPHDSFFSSDESFHSHAGMATLTRVRIIDPLAEDGEHSVAWLQSKHTARSKRLSFPENQTETEFSPCYSKDSASVISYWGKFGVNPSRHLCFESSEILN